MVEDGYDLLARDAFEVVQELVDGRAVFESFEKRGDGEASVLEDPAPLTLSGRRSMALQLSQWLMVELSPCAALTC